MAEDPKKAYQKLLAKRRSVAKRFRILEQAYIDALRGNDEAMIANYRVAFRSARDQLNRLNASVNESRKAMQARPKARPKARPRPRPATRTTALAPTVSRPHDTPARPARPAAPPAPAQDPTGGKQGGPPPGYQQLQNSILAQQAEASRIAREQEARAQRQAAMREAAFEKLDLAFNNRQADHQAAYDARLVEGTSSADEWKRHRERMDKFALAGRGLLGGSAHVETEGLREEGYGARLADAERVAREARMGLEQADRSRRDELRGQIARGVPIGRAGTGYSGLFPALPDYRAANKKHTGSAIAAANASGLIT